MSESRRFTVTQRRVFDFTQPLDILLLEDSEADAELLVRALHDAQISVSPRVVSDRHGFLDALSAETDLVLADYSLPGFDALEALALRDELGFSEVPVIIVSGALTDDQASAVLACGGVDYLIKDRLARLGAAVTNAVVERRLRHEYEMSLEVIQKGHRTVEVLLERLPVGVLFRDQDGVYTRMNEEAVKILGVSKDALLGRGPAALLSMVKARDESGNLSPDRVPSSTAQEGDIEPREIHISRSSDGQKRVLKVASASLEHEGAVEGSIVVFSDVTEERRTAAAANRNSKMHALGQLAGGVAHDFNNVLSIIIGCSEFLKPRVAELGQEAATDLDQIVRAAGRATDLTKQLLTLSRSQPSAPSRFALKDLVSEVKGFLHRTVRESITISCDCDPATPHVIADPSEIEQVLLNLALNARDAMPMGGNLSIRTSRRVVGNDATEALAPGEYAFIEVEDSGIGIPPQVKDRIFDAFFTTKEPDKGTGLGLATAYSIVKKAGGSIEVESAVGRTLFSVSLPAAGREMDSTPPTGSSPRVDGLDGAGKVIVVIDDQGSIRDIVVRLLADSGFTLLTCASPLEVLELASRGQSIDILLTDVVMPGMTGQVLHDELSQRMPDVETIFMSGYTKGIVAEHGSLQGKGIFLPKPFDRESLCGALGEALTRIQRRAS